MNIREVYTKFATDEQCLQYIEKMRWRWRANSRLVGLSDKWFQFRVCALQGQVSDAGRVKSSLDSVNPSETLTDAVSSIDKNGTSQE